MDYNPRPHGQRETVLSIFLALLAVIGFVFFFFMLCGGFSLYVLVVIATLTLLCLVNYLLWGRSFSKEVAGEREEDEARAALDEEDWGQDEP